LISSLPLDAISWGRKEEERKAMDDVHFLGTGVGMKKKGRGKRTSAAA